MLQASDDQVAQRVLARIFNAKNPYLQTLQKQVMALAQALHF